MTSFARLKTKKKVENDNNDDKQQEKAAYPKAEGIDAGGTGWEAWEDSAPRGATRTRCTFLHV